MEVDFELYLRRQEKSYNAVPQLIIFVVILYFFLVLRASEKIYIRNAFVSCIIFDPFLFITSTLYI